MPTSGASTARCATTTRSTQACCRLHLREVHEPERLGAYSTEENITGYISRNTIVPRLFDQAKRDCAIAFKPCGSVRRLLVEEPGRYSLGPTPATPIDARSISSTGP